MTFEPLENFSLSSFSSSPQLAFAFDQDPNALSLGIFNRIWAQDGFKGLYRGLGPTIVGYLPTWAIYFTVYDKVKASMGALRGKLLSSYFPSLFPSDLSSSNRHYDQQAVHTREGRDDNISLDL